jgi:hypothetical protein
MGAVGARLFVAPSGAACRQRVVNQAIVVKDRSTFANSGRVYRPGDKALLE